MKLEEQIVKKYKKYKKNEQLIEILEIIAKTGFILTLVVLTPNAAGHIMKLLGMVPDYKSKARMERSLKRLEDKKLISYKQGKNGYCAIELTPQGKLYWLRLNIKNLKLQKDKKWDGLWRMITFDIPEEKAYFRQRLAGALRLIGMYNLEKSIYIYPYECKETIFKIVEAFEVRKYVRFMFVQEIERDMEAKKFFKL